MAQGKRAKILNPKQENVVLRHLETTRYPERDRVLFLLSMKAGLRAGDSVRPEWPVIHSERGRGLSGASVAVWFHRLYSDLGLEGCSSHSGRRTFVTRAAKKCIEAGGSLRDVQQLAGHSHLATTQRYIEGDSEAKRRLVSMI